MNRETIRRMYDQQEAAITSDTARLANELQAQFPAMTRTHALNEARRLVCKYGIGMSLAK